MFCRHFDRIYIIITFEAISTKGGAYINIITTLVKVRHE